LPSLIEKRDRRFGVNTAVILRQRGAACSTRPRGALTVLA
jgi:hypothetical protein